MILSRASKYAILSTLFLTINSTKENKVSAKYISESLAIPSPFLAKLFQKLAKSKIISSAKGPTGGFYLTKRNGAKTVMDIIECIDGVEKINECFLGLNKCDSENPCPVHFIVSPFKDEIMEKFRDKTISEFAEEVKENGHVLTIIEEFEN